MAGGGIGEAMLLGAATGGITSLITKRDPLQGALLGAAGGGIGGALKTAFFPGAAEAAQTASQAGPVAAVPNELAAQIAAAPPPPVSDIPIRTVTDQGITNFYGASPDIGSQVTNLMPGESGGILAGAGSKASDLLGGIGDAWNALPTEKKFLYGGLGGLGAYAVLNRASPQMFEEEEPNWDRWKKFRPTFYAAEGGAVPRDTMYRGNQNMYTSNVGPLDEPSTIQVPQQEFYGAAPAAGFLGNSVRMMAGGGISSLGHYSDGGQLLQGPGDGMSDDIPASIGEAQPARLAEGEFVVPADVVSHLGNGSTDAGARQLYAMMARVREARTGNPKQGKEIDPTDYLVA